ncbi:D-galactosyl-beta-1-_3-N-acetyl-D-hexosamine phosphorylase [Anaerohalosphaera lusitana]|uniref:D-galactosyl-beta-1->3-N-acetyl-D-hexosamine phosphorylase n=1 Tax=Anaerohalosphaera lusitana TaxID=1936003 RepID=A0A1U9NJR1_9BACT|nr:1,3-beta-galactosyl-N-acetylhexosamine phosphorylase [Anaerohalosphaera lusitana]AQT68161.1 D-galactosyl-beta-1->3-N-acetyl-D-hexosamine phosphorylase [Anaerohalosphaera lusitana]
MSKYKELEKKGTDGFVTLPAESGQEEKVVELINKWGSDAIRDSDGTELSPELVELGKQVYSTICLVRADQEWPRKNWDKLPQKFLMSEHVTATSDKVEIDPMENYFREKYEIDRNHDEKEWWQVFDRTTGEEVSTDDWEFDGDRGLVVIKNAKKFHVYTVNFLVYQIWDSTSMYNHISNGWTCPHVVSTEPYHADARKHLMDYFDNWLETHPNTDVVRLTTLAYHFVLDSDKHGVDKYRDWVGYMDTVTVEALQDFEKEYGYRLTSEDFVDEGYYNATYRVPKKRYLDWMQFIHKFVIEFGKELVDKVHAAGKKAAIFQGDHWVGVEPYSDDYPKMGIDINVGACEDGVALRRLADSPWDEVKEIRLYPYFFPDVFCEGGKPTEESVSNWVKIRRAMLRKPIDRIGYGGYLSLAKKFPEFVEQVSGLCDEFRQIKENSGKTEPYSAPVKVAILNAWGKWRSWLNNFGRDQKFFIKRPDVIAVAGSNLLECISGLPVEIQFMSFDDILTGGVPDDVDVIINDGEDGTAWSGGEWWVNEQIVSTIREWIYNGGGFVGNLGPSAYQHQGRYFQLSDVMGVEREIGNQVMAAGRKFEESGEHFITADAGGKLDFGTDKSYVFASSEDVRVLEANGLHIRLAAKDFGKGRAVYMAGLPYSIDNSRMLHRALLWSAGQESELKKWFSSNVNTECAAYPEKKCFVVVNNASSEQTTTVYDGDGESFELTLDAYGSKWFSME